MEIKSISPQIIALFHDSQNVVGYSCGVSVGNHDSISVRWGKWRAEIYSFSWSRSLVEDGSDGSVLIISIRLGGRRPALTGHSRLSPSRPPRRLPKLPLRTALAAHREPSPPLKTKDIHQGCLPECHWRILGEQITPWVHGWRWGK